MDNSKMKAFLKLASKANVIIMNHKSISDLVSFNNFFDSVKFYRQIQKRSDESFFEHIENLASLMGQSQCYLECLKVQLKETLDSINFRNDCYYHWNFIIKDRKGLCINYIELSDDLKAKISHFISIQYHVLWSLIAKIFPEMPESESKESESKKTDQKILTENATPPKLIWLGTKTELVELANAIYSENLVGVENGTLTKKQFMENISVFFNIEIPSYKILQSKSMLRTNATTVLDRLQKAFNAYKDRLID